MATALKHRQRNSRNYQKNQKNVGSAVMFLANKSAAKQASSAARFSVAQMMKNMFRKKGDK